MSINYKDRSRRRFVAGGLDSCEVYSTLCGVILEVSLIKAVRRVYFRRVGWRHQCGWHVCALTLLRTAKAWPDPN